ncbi:hypothetical protein ACLMJK_008158 [Lecanora helva]
MSGANRKQLPGNSPSQRPPTTPNSRNSPAKSSTSINGIGRSPSLRGSGGLNRPGRGGSHTRSPQTSFLSTNETVSDATGEDDARAEHASLLEELRNRVQKAETASEEYQRQLNLLQARLDESHQEHGRLEDRLHHSDTRVQELESDQAALMRQKRDVEDLFEAERNALLQDKKEQQDRIEEFQTVNQRLKENLAQREKRGSVDGARGVSRTNSGNELGQFAPPSTVQRNESADGSEVLMQKDRVIKSLRLELAEAQIKIMEIDSNGGGKIHELEKKLMEVKINNARLTEDNESYQLLLSEKTLNGDFSKTETMQQSSGLGSLAEELGSEDTEEAESKTNDNRQFEAEIKSLKDQNKALALYIERIIGRLLQHKEFENVLEKAPDLISGAPSPPSANVDKDLPPPPPAKDDAQPAGFLQRARSVVTGQAKRPRPMSQMITSTPPPPVVSPGLPNEDPATAPSVPLGRSQSVRGSSHNRTQSEIPLANQMHRGPPSTGSGVPLASPGTSPGMTTATRSSFFPSPAPPTTATPSTNATSRAPSSSRLSQDGHPKSSSNSTFSDHSGGGGGGNGGMDSPPRSSATTNNYPGAVMTQNRLRPLRLVQENPAKEEDPAAVAARKKANRGSWMPAWMERRTTSNENV